MRQLLLTGKVEIGEHHLTFANQRILRLNGFLHLHNHVGLRIDILYGRQNLRSNLLVRFIAEPAAIASSVLYKDSMSVFNQLGNTRRCHAHAVLIVLNLLGNSYFHCFKSLVKRILCRKNTK